MDEKAASLRQQRVGNIARGRGLSLEMHGLRTPGDGAAQAGGKKCEENPQKSLKRETCYGKIGTCDMPF